MVSIRKNFFYNALLTVSNYIFPLVTYPYVSRVLGVSNIGICNFVDSIVNYFILFSMMGISIVGMREIAVVRDDREARNRVFSGLLNLNLITTAVAALVLIVAIYRVPSLAEYRTLLWIGVAKLMANFLCMDWLFRGLEEFKYVTNRTILVKCLYVAAVFLFVRESSDYWVYYLLTTLVLVLNAGFNFIFSRRFVRFRFRGAGFKAFAGPFFIMGVYMLLTSLYTSFNVFYLGVVSDTEQVGYYTSATKIFSMLIALFTAFTTVMLPRMSAVLSEGKIDDFHALITKSVRVLILFGVPISFLMLAGAPDIVRIVSGEGYEGAVVPMMTVAPLVVVIGLEQIFVVQVMMPMKWDRVILICSTAGAVVGVLLNFLLVKHFLARGSAVVWLVSELVVLSSALYFLITRLHFPFPFRTLLKEILLSLPLLALLLVMSRVMPGGAFLRLAAEATLTGLYFLAVHASLVKQTLHP